MNYKSQILTIISLTAFTYAIDTTNNHITTDGIGETYISGQTFNNKKVYYDIQDDLAIFEGDIVLGTVDETEKWREIEETNSSTKHNSSKAQIIKGARYRWPNGVIPYTISSNVSSKTRGLISRAIAHISARTSVRFIPRTGNHSNYVEIKSNQHACYSNVGNIKRGKQTINVVSACGYGGIIHELTHTIGLWHEQSRIDRNNYVRINWNNIPQNKRYNFNQHIYDGVAIGSYDYGSLMHYGAYAFGKGKQTIVPLQSGVHIGQRKGLSQGDITAINSMYPGGGGGSTANINYEFNSHNNAQGWKYKNLKQYGSGPTGGAWYFQARYNDPQLISPALNLNANVLKKVVIQMANDHNPAHYGRMQVFWKKSGQGYSAANSKTISVTNHGGWTTYTIDMHNNPRWNGNISQIRIDPIYRGNGHWLAFNYIRFTR